VNIGTHQTHCCKQHGCKYGYKNEECPVEAGTVEQEQACESCKSSALIDAQIRALQAEREWSVSLESKGIKIYDDYDADYYDYDIDD
jgi:hypothetical protein